MLLERPSVSVSNIGSLRGPIVGEVLSWITIVERYTKRLLKVVGSQPPPACCSASHILLYYVEDYSRGALEMINPFCISHTC